MQTKHGRWDFFLHLPWASTKLPSILSVMMISWHRNEPGFKIKVGACVTILRWDSESVDPAFNGCKERSEIWAVGRRHVNLVHAQDGYVLVWGDVFSRNYDPHIYNKLEVFFRSGYYLPQLKRTWRRRTHTEDGNIFGNFCCLCNGWLYIYTYIYPELMRVSVGVFRAQRFTYYLHEWSEPHSAPTELGQKYQWGQYKATDSSSLNWSLRWKWMCICIFFVTIWMRFWGGKNVLSAW